MEYITGTSSQCKTRNQQQTLSALEPIEIPSNEKFNPATQESWPEAPGLSLSTLLNLMSKSGRPEGLFSLKRKRHDPEPQNSLYPHSWMWCQNPDDLKDCLRTYTRLMTPSPNTLSLSTLLNLVSKSWRPEGLSSHKNCCWVLGLGPDSYMFHNIVFAYDNEWKLLGLVGTILRWRSTSIHTCIAEIT